MLRTPTCLRSPARPAWGSAMDPQVGNSQMPGSGRGHHVKALVTDGALGLVTPGPSMAPTLPPSYSGKSLLLGGPQPQGHSSSGARGPWGPRLLRAPLPQVVHLHRGGRPGAGEPQAQPGTPPPAPTTPTRPKPCPAPSSLPSPSLTAPRPQTPALASAAGDNKQSLEDGLSALQPRAALPVP